MISNYCAITAESLQTIKSSHWNIEMQHWILDVQLNEDKFTNRKDNAVINNSMLKRFVMRIKKNEETYKGHTMKGFFYKKFKRFRLLIKNIVW